MITEPEYDEIERRTKKIIQDEIKHLPSKEDFYYQMAKLMGEVKAMRDSQELHANSHKEINDEIDKLKKAVFSKN